MAEVDAMSRATGDRFDCKCRRVLADLLRLTSGYVHHMTEEASKNVLDENTCPLQMNWELRNAVLLLSSDTSPNMAGQNLIVDGGRSVL